MYFWCGRKGRERAVWSARVSKGNFGRKHRHRSTLLGCLHSGPINHKHCYVLHTGCRVAGRPVHIVFVRDSVLIEFLCGRRPSDACASVVHLALPQGRSQLL